jgi:hypothetical protein
LEFVRSLVWVIVMRNKRRNHAILCAVIPLLVVFAHGCGTTGGTNGGGNHVPPVSTNDGFSGRFGDAVSGGSTDTASGAASSSGGGGACTPDCNKKVCGGDGCGGSCGTCADGDVCTAKGCQKLAPADACKESQCDVNAYCVSDNGKANCICKTSWQGDGHSCVDVNECKTNNGDCPTNSLCENVVGAPRVCKCAKGYEGNGYVCTDVDECKSVSSKCPEHSICKNTAGSFDCVCEAGFKGSAQVGCKDVDECLAGTSSCPSNTYCTNTAGGYVCACNEGYKKKNGACADVDECADGVDDCDQNATCANTAGSFSCSCKNGYEGDGKLCNKTDLCKTANCHVHAKCSEGPGGLPVCACKAGYDGDGKSCYPAIVNITLIGAIIRPRPSQQSCWDPGCNVTVAQIKKVTDAAAKAAAAFKGNPYLTAASYALKLLPINEALAGIAGKTSKPDVTGTVKLLPSGPTLSLPSGGTAEDTLTPKWKGKSFSNIPLTSLVGLTVDLDDADLFTDDPIGQVKVPYGHLVKAVAIGKVVPIPTFDQGSGDILFVIVQLDMVQKCGDSQCTGSESASNCALDCAGGGATTNNGGSCKGLCGKYDKSWKCQCDSQCDQFNDCCADIKTVCP